MGLLCTSKSLPSPLITVSRDLESSLSLPGIAKEILLQIQIFLINVYVSNKGNFYLVFRMSSISIVT